MSFGAPPSLPGMRPTPPERGSFPLDHDGECKTYMRKYLKCMSESRSVNVQDCRLMARDYLNCRMDRGLMLRDDWKNLGLPDEAPAPPAGPSATESPSK
ncbi:uncharacterized protein V1510DRAFT_404997 [Dipodascopsis tothii]|uniref:uncharacterized protein n=1 Tax=Dipodascopsis tothii TaxID=44089 RepID=UPI0034CED85A